jgi:hypothetical protein
MFTRPGVLLRLEEISLLAVSVVVYQRLHFSWLLFALLFFVPDIFMLGYLANPRFGAALYNFGHARFVALALLAFGHFGAHPVAVAVSLIWFSHIAFDRAVGYGFKYPTFFKDTHLQHLD